ncbi:MAG: MFS transporter [Opitutaceae bacterium]|nr:MFS transporter [Opitutaceae bacterium]
MEGFVAMPLVTMSLPVNVFLTALVTRGLDLPKESIGLISALPFIGNFLPIFVAPLLSHWRPPKTLAVLFASLHLITWLVLGVMLSWIPVGDPAAAGRWLIAWFAVSSVCIAIAGVSWNSWVQEWVPVRLRGKYFGRRNRLLQVSTLLFLLATGWVLAQWDYAMPAFQGVIAGAVILRLFSLRWSWQMPTRPHRESTAPKLPFREQLAVLRGARSFVLFIAFGAIWSFAANCFGPFYHVFMFEELGFSAFDVGILSTLSALGGALSLPAWGALLDRFGNKPVMAFSLILWQGMNFVWCFIGPENRHWLYPLWVWGGMTSAGFVLGQFTFLLKLIPLEAKNLAIGFNLAITSLFAAIAPIIGGAILGWALARGDGALTVYHLCFIVQPVLALLGSMLLLRIHEQQASSLTMVFGAMRNIRTLSGVLGLDFFINYVFYRPGKR